MYLPWGSVLKGHTPLHNWCTKYIHRKVENIQRKESLQNEAERNGFSMLYLGVYVQAKPSWPSEIPVSTHSVHSTCFHGNNDWVYGQMQHLLLPSFTLCPFSLSHWYWQTYKCAACFNADWVRTHILFCFQNRVVYSGVSTKKRINKA